MTDLDSLSPADLDRLAAEVCGPCVHTNIEHYVRQNDTGFICKDCGQDPCANPVPHPTTDPAAAHALLDKLDNENFTWQITRRPSGVRVIISPVNEQNKPIVVTSETFCRAVTVAFLKSREAGK